MKKLLLGLAALGALAVPGLTRLPATAGPGPASPMAASQAAPPGWSAIVGGFHHVHAIEAQSADHAWAAGAGIIELKDGIWRTTDFAPGLLFEGIAMTDDRSGWAVANDSTNLDESTFGVIVEIEDGAIVQRTDYPGYYWTEMRKVSADDIWAVGTREGETEPLIYHFDGNNWTDMAQTLPTIDWREVPVIESIDMRSADDGVAIARLGILLKWDGIHWSELDRIPESIVDNAVYGVDYSEDGTVWLAGDQILSYWNGDFLIHEKSDPTSLPIAEICMLKDGTGWAVGDLASLFYFDTLTWTLIDNYSALGTLEALTPIPGTDRLMAGGDDALILDLDVKGAIRLLHPEKDWKFNGMSIPPAGDAVWVAGSYQQDVTDPSSIRPAVTVLQDDQFKESTLSTETTIANDLEALAPDSVWVVGGRTWMAFDALTGRSELKTRSDLWHFDGRMWEAVESPTEFELTQVSFDRHGSGFALGRLGSLGHWGSQSIILGYVGGKWSISRDVEYDYLNTLVVNSATDVWVGGENCNFDGPCDDVTWHFDGKKWSQFRLFGTQSVTAFSKGDQTAWASVCHGRCALYRQVASQWVLVQDLELVETAGLISSIVGTPSMATWAAGDGGVFRFDGERWTFDLPFIHHQESFTVRALEASESQEEKTIWAIGDFRSLLVRHRADSDLDGSRPLPAGSATNVPPESWEGILLPALMSK